MTKTAEEVKNDFLSAWSLSGAGYQPTVEAITDGYRITYADFAGLQNILAITDIIDYDRNGNSVWAGARYDYLSVNWVDVDHNWFKMYFDGHTDSLNGPDLDLVVDDYQDQIDNLEQSIINIYNDLSDEISATSSAFDTRVTSIVEGLINTGLKLGGVVILGLIVVAVVTYVLPKPTDLL